MNSEINTLAVAGDKTRLSQIGDIVQSLGLNPRLMLGTAFLPAEKLPYDLILYSSSGEMEKFETLLAKVKRRSQVVVLVPEECDLTTQIEFFSRKNCNHVMKTDRQWQRRLSVLLEKLISGDIFGIEKYLDEGAAVKYLRLEDYRGRSSAIDRMMDYAKKAKFRLVQRQQIAQVCEELLMNALYNAPVDSDGSFLFAEVEPKQRLGMATPRPVSLRYSVSNDRFVLAVRDRFGTLNKTRITDYLLKCTKKADQIDTKTSGAGLGLYLVAGRADEYINNIAPTIATEAVAIFERREKSRGHGLANIGVFVHPGVKEAGRESC